MFSVKTRMLLWLMCIAAVAAIVYKTVDVKALTEQLQAEEPDFCNDIVDVENGPVEECAEIITKAAEVVFKRRPIKFNAF